MRTRPLASLVLLVALTGCGLPSTSTAPAAKTTTQVSATKLKFASTQLIASPTIVRAEGISDLELKVWGNKPVRNMSVYWRCFGGQLEPLAMGKANTWTAPKQEGTYRVQADAVIQYTDGTSDIESTYTMIRVIK